MSSYPKCFLPVRRKDEIKKPFYRRLPAIAPYKKAFAFLIKNPPNFYVFPCFIVVLFERNKFLI